MKKFKDLKIGEKDFAYRAEIFDPSNKEIVILKTEITRKTEQLVYADNSDVLYKKNIKNFTNTEEIYIDTEKEALKIYLGQTERLIEIIQNRIKHLEEEKELILKEIRKTTNFGYKQNKKGEKNGRK